MIEIEDQTEEDVACASFDLDLTDIMLIKEGLFRVIEKPLLYGSPLNVKAYGKAIEWIKALDEAKAMLQDDSVPFDDEEPEGNN